MGLGAAASEPGTLSMLRHLYPDAKASDWGGPAERKWVRPALPDSVEELFHDAGEKGFMLSFGHAP